MKKNRTFVYSAVLAAFVLIYIGSYVFEPSYRTGNEHPALLAGFDPAAATLIEIENIHDRTVCIKESGKWHILSGTVLFPAREARIVSIIDLLEQLKVVREVSSNPETWNSLGFTEDSTQTLSVYDQKKNLICRILIGGSSEFEYGDYVRLEGSDQVLLTDMPVSDLIAGGFANLAETRIFPDDLGDGNAAGFQLTAVRPLSFSFTLFRDQPGSGGKWIIYQFEQDIDQIQVKKLVASAVNLEGDNFVTDQTADAEARLSNPDIKMEILDSGGRNHILNISASSTEKLYYAKLKGSKIIYKLEPAKVAGIIRAVEDLYYNGGAPDDDPF